MILDRLLSRPAGGPIQKRATLRNPIEAWVKDWLVGDDTASGIEVNERTAFNCSALFCAVTVISNAVKSLPFFTYQDQPDGGKKKAKSHPVFRLLHRRPNPEQTPATFKAYMQISALLWPAGYAWIKRDGGGSPRELWPIHPRRVTPDRSDTDGRLIFRISNADGTQSMINDEDMLRIYGPSQDSVGGLKLLDLARETIGTSLATEKHAATFFGNNAMPGGIIRHPQTLEENAANNLRSSWERMYGGPSNANRTAILEEGMEYQAIGLPNEVSQFLETRQFGVQDFARWFNLPPHKLKDLMRATFSNIEEQEIDFVVGTVLPWLIVWEEECNIKLFRESESDHFVKYQVKGLLRGNAESRAAFYNQMWMMGGYSTNDIRAFEDENPIGPAGDKHFVPMNMTTLEDLQKGKEDEPEAVPALPAPEPEPEDDDAEDDDARSLVAYRRLFRDAYGRIVTREVDRIRRAMKKHQPDVAAFAGWVSEFYGNGHQTFVRQTLTPVVASVNDMTAGTLDPEAAVKHYVGSSRGQLLGLMRDAGDGEAWAALDARLGEWAERRADKATDAAVAATRQDAEIAEADWQNERFRTEKG